MHGLFYNPNIYPLAEYKLRRQAVADMAKRLSVKVTYKDDNLQPVQAGCSWGRSADSSGRPYSTKIFAPPADAGGPSCKNFRTPHSQPACLAAKEQRCSNCWRMRLGEAANAAKREHHDAFTTTLLISPYQNHNEIRVIGRDLEKTEEINFYYDDFRVGFKASQQMAKEQGVYRQKYCGCESSIKENK